MFLRSNAHMYNIRNSRVNSSRYSISMAPQALTTTDATVCVFLSYEY